MVPGVKSGAHSSETSEAKAHISWARIVFEVVFGVIAIGIFCLKIANYADPAALRLSVIRQAVATAVRNTENAIGNLAILNNCPGGLSKNDVEGGYVCVRESGRGPYTYIYGSYPLVGRGRESIYSSTDEGSIAAANALLHNEVVLPRYRPVRLPSLPTWSENPYSASYWRFEFYSLRPTLNLLYAYRTTGKVVYAKQLLRLDSSFIAAEGRSRWAWADPHTVAFRCMALVDTWWKLRQDHQLPEPASTAILEELEKTGRFLADPNNYNSGEDFSTSEAAALYELAVAFPTLPDAPQWLSVAKDRLRWQLALAIDADGQLIDNAPSYDFDALNQYWQIHEYSLAQGYPIAADFGARLRSMLNFATYILQPNTRVPLLGASVEKAINDYGVYSDMAGIDPGFRYVVTHGAQGSRPPEKSVSFAASALTVMRSGWGDGPQFSRSTYLTYNVGRYRTAHSDLDALGITLYGDGGDLLPGPGRYTDSSGAYRDYFHGTMSHNTVVVDGQSQIQGNGAEGPLVTKDGLTYQSAESSLYPGVTHRRLVMMIDANHLLVVNRLSSTADHTYQQMFHLFPGARLRKSGLRVSGIGGTPRREVTIQQLLPRGITESDTINDRGRRPDGLCSERIGELQPCYAVSYSARGKDATFVTLLTVGAPQQGGFAIKVSDDGGRLGITDGQRHLGVSLSDSAAIAPRAWATAPSPPPVGATPVPAVLAPGSWTTRNDGFLSFSHASGDSGPVVVGLSTNSGSPVYMQNNSVRLNLDQHNVRLSLKVTGLAQLSELRLRLSNDHWAKWVTLNPLQAYTPDRAGQWVSLFLGAGGQWGSAGGWKVSAPGFNWADIDGMEIEMITRSSGGPSATVSIGGLTLVPTQNEGKLVFAFDNGYQSILPAARYLHQEGMAGDVGVVGKYVDYPAENYLNVFQLKALQNKWGWNMVNQTQQDVNAVRQYYDLHDVGGYAPDVVQQAAWLEANGLNSAPNWLIYPYGSTNTQLEGLVGRYYMFARLMAGGPDAYPYGDPHGIASLDVHCSGGGRKGDGSCTPPAQVLSAVHQAVIHHMTLILTFDHINSERGEIPGYPLALFKELVNGIRRSGIKVMTFSELDRSNGVPVKNRIDVTAGRPSQIVVSISG